MASASLDWDCRSWSDTVMVLPLASVSFRLAVARRSSAARTRALPCSPLARASFRAASATRTLPVASCSARRAVDSALAPEAIWALSFLISAWPGSPPAPTLKAELKVLPPSRPAPEASELTEERKPRNVGEDCYLPGPDFISHVQPPLLCSSDLPESAVLLQLSLGMGAFLRGDFFGWLLGGPGPVRNVGRCALFPVHVDCLGV